MIINIKYFFQFQFESQLIPNIKLYYYYIIIEQTFATDGINCP